MVAKLERTDIAEGTILSHRGARPGFTLPELLITIILISILFSLAMVFMTSLRSSSKLRNSEIAVALAQQAIEACRGAPFALLDDADARENSLEYDFNNSHSGIDLYEPNFVSGQVKYDRKVEVVDVQPVISGGTPLGLKHVTVKVQLTLQNGEKPSPLIVTATISNLN